VYLLFEYERILEDDNPGPLVLLRIAPPYNKSLAADTKAIVDTGASHTCIPINIIDTLGKGKSYDQVEIKGVGGIVINSKSYIFHLKILECEFLDHEVVALNSIDHCINGDKIECGDKKIFFTGDHEALCNIYAPDDGFYEEYDNLINQKNRIICDFISKVDVLIADSAYTKEEYQAKKGWGHGTFDSCIDMAKQAGVGSLYFTHHEPTRNDDDLDSIYNKILIEDKNNSQGPKYFLAQEGLEIEI